MPKGKKRATNASDGPKPKRRRAAQPEQEVEYRTLADLPVVLCNEIFCDLDVSDLFHLTRVNKTIRGYLREASMSEVWNVAAKRESVNVPECPGGMTLPGWLSLIFEKHCRFCDASGVPKVIWELKTRACKSCLLKSPIFRRVPADGSDPGLDLQKLHELLPSVSANMRAQNRQPYKAYQIFFEGDVEEFAAKEAIGGKVYTDWANERTLVMGLTRSSSLSYDQWYSTFEEAQKERRYEERAQLRRNQIKTRLAAEGWMDELQVLEEDLAVLYGSRFKHHELFARGGQLKDWEWKGIRHKVLELLKAEVARREMIRTDRERGRGYACGV